MLYFLPSVYVDQYKNIDDIGNWLGNAFGWDDVWRFRSFKKNIITCHANWKKVGYVEIDKPEDCLFFELMFNKAKRC